MLELLVNFFPVTCLQGEMKANEVTNNGLKCEPNATNIPSCKSGETDTQMIDQLPQVESIGIVLLL